MQRSILGGKKQLSAKRSVHPRVARKSSHTLPAPSTYRKDIRTRSGADWMAQGEKNALALFKEAANRIPAYKDFLTKHFVNAEHVQSGHDFAQLPETTKENYIQAYPLEARSWDGDIMSHRIFAVSSGTSGEPTLWPRGAVQEQEAAFVHEFLFTELFDIDQSTTLMIIGFPMGIYVSGIATTLPAFAASIAHPNLSIATVGNHKDGVLKLLRATAGKFDQVVLVGHPFFLKDILESGTSAGLDWQKLKPRMLSCSEGFTEAWRTYTSAIAGGSTRNTFFNTYGSSEFLLVGYENPETILIRQLAEKDETLSQRLFAAPEPPNLFQYNPLLRFIESNGKDLLITASSGIPLIKFNQHDAGSVIPHERMHELLKEQNKDTRVDLKADEWSSWKLPFVSLFGRSDRTLVFYAANIYPEHISAALEVPPFLSDLTGKFIMKKVYTETMDQRLEIMIELRENTTAHSALAESISSAIVQNLEKVNMEYVHSRGYSGKDMVPRIILKQYQDPEYFKQGLKPRFIAD